MQHIGKIIVSVQFEEEEMDVGELVRDRRLVYFKYYPGFIKSGLELSPFKLKLNRDVYKADEAPFDGLFGVFADSLPDGWGRLLLNRSLMAKGIDIGEITVLERLAYVGRKGMGALMYRPEMSEEHLVDLRPGLDEISKAAGKIMDGTAVDMLDELYSLGGSSGGARPKILVGYHPASQQLTGDSNQLPEGYEHWLIKFSSPSDMPDIAHIEYAYYKMAIDAGIEMSECKLFKGKSGKAYFGTKRFDRVKNRRLHLHSAAGLMHDYFRLSSLDYGNLMDCAFRLEKDVQAYEKILRLAAFNVFAHNRDDHSKNFAFLMDATGTWKFAPAYDLTFSGSGHGMHSTMVAGESANPGKKDLMKLGNYFKMKNAEVIIDEVQQVIHNWKKYADSCGVSKISGNKINRIIGRKR